MSGKPFREGTLRECRVCGLDKPLESFPWRNKAKGYRTYECWDCGKIRRDGSREQTNARHTEMRRIIIDKINELKSQPCMDCGVSYPPYVMDFDHRGGKRMNVSKFKAGTWAWSTVQAEIDKCDLICANCHRLRTFKEK